MGGIGWAGKYSTEFLRWNDAKKIWKLGSNLTEPLASSAAISSRSDEFVGYLVGGRINNGVTMEGQRSTENERTSKIWGLRRSDMEWIEISKRLKIPRNRHSLVNVQPEEIRC